MVKASVIALLGMSMFAGAQVASAQNAAVSEEEIKCFVSGCDEAAASDEAGSDEDECLTSGICKVDGQKTFKFVGTAPGKVAAARPANGRTSPSKPAGQRYVSGGSAKFDKAKVGTASRLAMPGSRVALDMRLSFELGSATLTADARRQADVFARTLKDAPAGRIFTIEGHTDNVGSATYNRQLSRERAQSVVSYLVAAGVPASKLKAVGYGFDQPRDGLAASDPGNRRVEIARY